jgi:multidrug efflux pump subunit AcrA (membrane-fusion protein)
VEAARASAEHDERVAEAELAARRADQSRLAANQGNGAPLAVEAARATAEHADTAARAEVAATIAERALVVLDPRQPETARAAADAKLALAQASALKTELESELAVQAAEREAQLAAEQLALAEAAVRSARLAGELAVRAALDQQKVAELDAKLAAERADRLGADLEIARSKLGVQVPVDELVFVPALPVRVEEVTALVGNVASGPILSVTDNQLAIDSGLALDAAPLVKAGMPVAIDEQALGIQARGVVAWVADTPGTNGVDGYHIYFEVRVLETPTPLQGFSLRLTIPIQSTQGEVTVVPISALSLAADGTSRVQVERGGTLEYVVVRPGLSADGFVEVTPVDDGLEPGQLVVVGYQNPAHSAATP